MLVVVVYGFRRDEEETASAPAVDRAPRLDRKLCDHLCMTRGGGGAQLITWLCRTCVQRKANLMMEPACFQPT